MCLMEVIHIMVCLGDIKRHYESIYAERMVKKYWLSNFKEKSNPKILEKTGKNIGGDAQSMMKIKRSHN